MELFLAGDCLRHVELSSDLIGLNNDMQTSVCVCVYAITHTHICACGMQTRMYACAHVIGVCMYVCMYITHAQYVRLGNS